MRKYIFKILRKLSSMKMLHSITFYNLDAKDFKTELIMNRFQPGVINLYAVSLLLGCVNKF